jgi:flagellar biosynthesis/type III secretory pathway M-ring protein FliF/YscJ
MLLDVLVGIPPIPRTPMTSTDIVVSWVTIGIIVALVLVAWIMIVVAAFRSVQKRQSQMKEAEREYEEVPQSTYHEQPQVQLPKEEVLSRR